MHYLTLSWIMLSHLVVPVSVGAPLSLLICLSGIVSLSLQGAVHRNHAVDISWLYVPIAIYWMVGFAGAAGHAWRDVLRDVVYGLSPVLMLIYGSMIASRAKFGREGFLLLLLVGALPDALLHLGHYLANPTLLQLDSVSIRNEIGTGVRSLVPLALALILVVPNWFSETVQRPTVRVIIATVLGLAIILSYSRSIWMQFAVILTALLIGRGLLGARQVALLVLLAFGAVQVLGQVYVGEEGEFLAKLARSVTEISLAEIDSIEEINANWRGYETSMGLSAWRDMSWGGMMLGGGFGQLVDIGLDIKLGDDYMRFIPVFHNGFVYILVKTGLIGITCYLLFFAVSLQFGRSLILRGGSSRLYGYATMGVLANILFVTYTTQGMPQYNDIFLVLFLAYLVSVAEIDARTEFTRLQQHA